MLHQVRLKQVKDGEGRPLRGLWESPIVRLEAVQGGWEGWVPVRSIGKSSYYEFRPVDMGGKFMMIGTYRTKDDCCVIAERLKSGTHVLRDQYRDSQGVVPCAVVEWSEVATDIAETA